TLRRIVSLNTSRRTTATTVRNTNRSAHLKSHLMLLPIGDLPGAAPRLAGLANRESYFTREYLPDAPPGIRPDLPKQPRDKVPAAGARFGGRRARATPRL